MEISNSCSESQITSVSQSKAPSTKHLAAAAVAESKQQQDSHHQQQPPSNSSDLKYLHKKFKRIASASLGEVTSAVAAESSASVVAPLPFEPVQPASSLTPPSPPPPPPSCAKGGNLVSSSGTNQVCEEQRVPPIVEASNYSRLQLTPSSAWISSGSDQQQQKQQQLSNGASLNCANHISDSNSFISNHNIARAVAAGESEDLKSYYPSVNNNSAINTSSDPSIAEKNQCTTTTLLSSSNSAAPLVVYESSNSASSPSFYGSNQQQQQQQGVVSEVVVATSSSNSSSSSPGRYVCPYCQMNCSKPSVLQKHIRRHTNERPFRCDPCGIAFKTKSNLYKHCRTKPLHNRTCIAPTRRRRQQSDR